MPPKLPIVDVKTYDPLTQASWPTEESVKRPHVPSKITIKSPENLRLKTVEEMSVNPPEFSLEFLSEADRKWISHLPKGAPIKIETPKPVAKAQYESKREQRTIDVSMLKSIPITGIDLSGFWETAPKAIKKKAFLSLYAPLEKASEFTPVSVEPYQQKSMESSHAKTRALERLSHLRKMLPADAKINCMVDLGTGNAQIPYYFSEEMDIPAVYGIDVYPQKDFKSPGNLSRVIYRQYANGTVNIPTGIADLVIILVSIHHIDLNEYIPIIRRILKPNGYLFIREHDVITEEQRQEVINHHTDLLLGEHIGVNITRLYSKDELTTILGTAGFRHVADSIYPHEVNNKQFLDHSLFQRTE